MPTTYNPYAIQIIQKVTRIEVIMAQTIFQKTRRTLQPNKLPPSCINIMALWRENITIEKTIHIDRKELKQERVIITLHDIHIHGVV